MNSTKRDNQAWEGYRRIALQFFKHDQSQKACFQDHEMVLLMNGCSCQSNMAGSRTAKLIVHHVSNDEYHPFSSGFVPCVPIVSHEGPDFPGVSQYIAVSSS